jgi:chaperonin cofactor prefoldin
MYKKVLCLKFLKENYNLLIDKNYQLEEQLRTLQKESKEKDEQIEKLQSELTSTKL